MAQQKHAMKVAIDVSPLSSGHKVRGVGFYLENLKKALSRYYPQNKYIFFESIDQVSEKVDIIHYPYFDPYSLSLHSGGESKTVVTVHDLTPIVFKKHFPPGIKGNMRWLIQKRRLKNVDLIITDSKSSKEDIKNIIGIADNKIKVVYLAGSEDFKNLENTESKEKIKKKYNLPQNFLLYVGDVTWNKNLPRIVEAVKKTKFTLVMVGKALVNEDYDESNPWNKDLVKVMSEIKNDKQFVRLGFVSNSDLNLIYNSASLLLMPSIYEGFGLPVLEAMQAGCPVLTSRGGSLGEVAGDGAIFVDPMSSNSITEGINRVMTDEKLRKDLIEKGLKRSSEFSWRKTAKDTVDAYEEVIK